jgi:hypothetical protein
MEIVNSITAELIKEFRVKAVAELEKARAQIEHDGYSGIETMYDTFTDLGSYTITYPGNIIITGNSRENSFVVPCKLPGDERISIVRLVEERVGNDQRNYVVCITNYGRVLKSLVNGWRAGFGWNVGSEEQNIKYIEHTPLPYKLPDWFIKAYKYIQTKHETGLQEIAKEFFEFAGKWKEFLTTHAEIDYEGLRIELENTRKEVECLEESENELFKENKVLKDTASKYEKTIKENIRLSCDNDTYKKYYRAMINFLNNNNVSCTRVCLENILPTFEEFTENRISIPKSEYNRYIEMEQELEEFRIYMKLKNKFVSGGIEQSRTMNTINSNVSLIQEIINEKANTI